MNSDAQSSQRRRFRLRRVVGWTLGGLAGLLVALLAGTLCGLDWRPYLTTSYYAETRARLDVLATNWHAVVGPLEAGFGRARLTPELNVIPEDPAHGKFRVMPLAGYGARQGRPATGTHDDLWVKAAAFRVGGEVAVVVGVDALIIPREVTAEAARRWEQELKLSRSRVYLGATHTHASLGAWGEGMVAEAFAGKFQPGVREWFAGQLVAAVRAALADLRPAEFGAGVFTASGSVRNRLVGTRGQVDDEFTYAVMRQTGGATAVLGVFGAHATVLPARMMEFSGDYPGAWQQAVEQATGGLAIFLAGGVGSQSPVAGESGLAGVQKMGMALAGEVLRRLPETRLTNRVALGVLGLETALPEPHLRVSDGLRLRPALARRLLPVGDRTLLQVVRLGDTVWVSTPCDFSGELASPLKDWLRARGRQGLLTSFNGDYLGYVIPAKYYHLGGYEPRTMSFFGPNLADYLDDLIRHLLVIAAETPAKEL